MVKKKKKRNCIPLNLSRRRNAMYRIFVLDFYDMCELILQVRKIEFCKIIQNKEEQD